MTEAKAAAEIHDTPSPVLRPAQNISPLPSVGRIVHWKATPHERFNDADIHPAIITRVWSPTCVNLQVFTDNGPVLTKTSQTLGTQWEWPPRV